jgi:homoserine acetyltransferase
MDSLEGWDKVDPNYLLLSSAPHADLRASFHRTEAFTSSVQLVDIIRTQADADLVPFDVQIGVSMGGMIALQLASMASFRVASLILAVTSTS